MCSTTINITITFTTDEGPKNSKCFLNSNFLGRRFANWTCASEVVNELKCYLFLQRYVFWKLYQNMMLDKLKHFVVMIKLSSNYLLLVFHETAEEKA